MKVIQSEIRISKTINKEKRRAHNSSPHKWYCHFWDWHNWYLTLLIKLKLILVNIGTLNYWYWAQFTLTLLKLDISDLQNDWYLQALIFGIIGISRLWFLELFVFSRSDIKHDWYMTWLALTYLILGISVIENYWYYTWLIHVILGWKYISVHFLSAQMAVLSSFYQVHKVFLMNNFDHAIIFYQYAVCQL